MSKRVVIVGAGWTGAVVADRLHAHGINVEVLEKARVVGGHSRTETLNGVLYEPNGPHILHTDSPNVVALWDRLGLASRPYQFKPMAEIELPDGSLRLMSWPIQLEELRALPDWKQIERELDALPKRPHGDDFETYAASLMGRRLYEYFIEGYTRKQWGREPSELSSSFAPKRIDLRRDGNRNLFRDAFQFWPCDGVNGAIEQLLSKVAVTCGAEVTVDDLQDERADAIVVTAALDEFTPGAQPLEWRGVHLRSRYIPTRDGQTHQAAYVINRNHMQVPYTRTIEAKHASAQMISGTVVSEEHPGAPARHYPVARIDGRYERLNIALQRDASNALAHTNVFFAGRLATYRYINQDEAIMDAWRCADDVLAALHA